ncbi:MAG: tRNA (adenosine(37)-N6)-dimethylallyltransferase MiaA [Clostridia bacterium]|nr:tRNA (adenosine(37)-N6)-dimethylallyltransferase MiaA [Clostridia bacterium]
MQKIVCIVGPTASGKTKLGIELCKKLSGEVVSADSMQIYKGMDIGTAKPSLEERDGVPHHLFDIVDANEAYSVSRFVEDADRAIEDIANRGKLPVIVGGTGLYIDALIRGGGFAEYDEDYRAYLMSKTPEELFDMLRQVDPLSAERLHLKDIKRITRALEIFHLSGKTIGEHNEMTQKLPPRYDAKIIGLTCQDRQILYDRIEKRVDEMLEMGLVEETEKLLSSGISETATSMQAIGYKEIIPAIKGEMSLDDAVLLLKQATRRLAKRQLTWFRRDMRIKWFYLDNRESFEDVLQASCDFVKNGNV